MNTTTNTTNTTNMTPTHDSSSILSIVLSTFLALGNHLFGWWHSMGLITISPYIQAIIIGILTSTVTHFMGKFWRKLDKKNKNHEAK